MLPQVEIEPQHSGASAAQPRTRIDAAPLKQSNWSRTSWSKARLHHLEDVRTRKSQGAPVGSMRYAQASTTGHIERGTTRWGHAISFRRQPSRNGSERTHGHLLSPEQLNSIYAIAVVMNGGRVKRLEPRLAEVTPSTFVEVSPQSSVFLPMAR